jgi:stage II sporulation protein D
LFKKLVRYLSVFFFITALLIQGAGGIHAESTNDNVPIVRVGVVPEAESIAMGSDGQFSIIDKVTGETLFQGSNEEVTVELAATSTIKTNYRLQTSWTTNNAYIADWLSRAKIAGYPTYVEPYNNGFRLFIGEFPTNASWSVRNAFRNKVIAEGFAGTDSFWKIVTYTEGQSQLRIYNALSEKYTFNPVRVIGVTGFVKINSHKYRGIGEAGFNSKGTLAGINELPIEDYLYGVVPCELPPVPYGQMEAQKSQAIAARTYALSNLGNRIKDGYDLLPTTSDQVYGGYESEHPVSNQAVDETRGIVATYDGDLIDAVFNSTCGGFSANNEDVWGSAAVPYLRGVPCAQRGEALEHVPTLDVFKNNSSAQSLRASREGEFDSDWSKYHRWHYEWTSEEISNVLSTYYGTQVGKVLAINAVERSSSGRVLKIEFVTENGTFNEFKDKIRWALKYIDANGTPQVLRSTLFFAEPIEDPSTKEIIGFEAYGGGWGHGLGLCQTGAAGMAEKGATYEDILKHYYQGISLEKRY